VQPLNPLKEVTLFGMVFFMILANS
jgi:hypothetical protein